MSKQGHLKPRKFQEKLHEIMKNALIEQSGALQKTGANWKRSKLEAWCGENYYNRIEFDQPPTKLRGQQLKQPIFLAMASTAKMVDEEFLRVSLAEAVDLRLGDFEHATKVRLELFVGIRTPPGCEVFFTIFFDIRNEQE